MGQVLQRREKYDAETLGESEMDVLPAEMMMRILQLLPPEDLKMVVLVCRKWRDMGEDPSLWTWCQVRYKAGSKSHLQKLTVRRLQMLQHLHVWYDEWKTGEMTEVFQAVEKLPKLREITGLNGYNYKSVEPGLFGRVMNKLEEVDISRTGMTSQHLQAVFTIMCQESQLKKLAIEGNNLSSIQPAVLAKAISKLEEINIGSTDITSEQVQAVFAAIAVDGPLRKLTIRHNDLSSVQPEVLVTALSKMEEVKMEVTNITGQQAQKLFSAIKQKGQLKRLNISGNDLSAVRPAVLAKGVARIEQVEMRETMITTEQACEMFAVLMEESQLKKLSLAYNNLSGIEPTVLATGVTRLEEVNLYFTKLGAEQVSCMLRQCLEQDTKLSKLTVREITDVDVEVELVRQARDKLGDYININNWNV